MSLKAPVTVICLGALVLFAEGCERTIEEGTFNFLTIGDSKEEVIEKVSKEGISHIIPTLENQISIGWDQRSSIGEFKECPGVVISGEKGLAITIAFAGDALSEIRSSVAARDYAGRYFRVGISRSETFEIALEVFLRDMGWRMSTYLPTSRWVRLRDLGKEDRDYLLRFDAWGFHGLAEYSRYYVIFKNGRLAKVKYLWSPLESP